MLCKRLFALISVGAFAFVLCGAGGTTVLRQTYPAPPPIKATIAKRRPNLEVPPTTPEGKLLLKTTDKLDGKNAAGSGEIRVLGFDSLDHAGVIGTIAAGVTLEIVGVRRVNSDMYYAVYWDGSGASSAPTGDGKLGWINGKFLESVAQ